MAERLVEQDVEEVVMESTAQYWRPVWEALEHHWRPRRRARAGASRLVYEERGPAVSAEAKKVRARKMIRELRSLAYRVELTPAPSSSPA